MKKAFAAIIALLCSFCAYSDDFSLQCQLEKNVFTQGEDVVVAITAQHPEVYKPLYWRAYLNARKVPAGFCDATGAYNNNHPKYPEIYLTRGEQKQPVKGYFYYPKVQASGEKNNIRFSSTNWPAGDYTVTLQVLFDHKKPTELKDKKKRYCYKQAHIKFTVETAGKKLDIDEKFSNTASGDDFTVAGSGKKAAVQTVVKSFFHNGDFYFQIEAFEPEMQKLVADKQPADSGNIWRNDSVEIAIASEPGALQFYKFIADCSGQYCDMLLTDNNTNKNIYNIFRDWSSKARFKVTRKTDRWIINAVVPAAAMVTGKTTPDSFRYNIVRHRRAGGKLETSSLVNFQKPGFHHPLEFIKLSADGFEKKMYDIRLEKFSHNYRNKGHLDISGVLKVGDCDLNFVKTVFTLRGNQSSYEQTLLENVKKNSARQIQTGLKGMKDGEYTLEYSIYTNSNDPVLLATGKKEITLQYNPLSLNVKNPAYRDCIFATMPDKQLRFEVVSILDTPCRLTAGLRGGKINLEKSFTAVKGANAMVFDMADLPDGKYILEIKKDKRTVLSRTIRKLPYRKGEVYLDKQGITYVDGVKTLPFGWFGNQPYDPDKSLNLLLEYITFSDAEHGRKHIAGNLRSGQRSIIYFTQEFSGTAWSKADIFAESKRKGTLSPIQADKVRETIKALAGEEGLFAWYLADEPEGRNHSSLFYEEAAAILRELDPYHPAIMLNYGIDGIRRFYKSCDILMPDCYPQYFEDGSTAKPRTATSDWVKTASELRPSWFCPQMTMWPARSSDGKLRGVAPDYRDQRMQFLQALIYNAKGFAMYTFYRSQIFSSLIIGHVELGQTLQMLKDYLLENTLFADVTSLKENNELKFGLKKYQDQYCLLVVNTSSAPQEIELKIAGIKEHTLYEAGGNGVLQIKKGICKDTLEARQSKIYISDKSLAQRVPDVKDIEKRIADFSASRKKPGNLIGTGELFEAQYRDMYKKNIYPEGITRITASSEKPNYTTSGMGTLYFLLDGITEPTWADFAWTPDANDEKPTLTLKLPNAKALERLILYSPGMTLAKGKVFVGDKTIPFDAVGKKVIEVKWNQSSADTVKIEFERTGATPVKGPFQKVFLSEIELY